MPEIIFLIFCTICVFSAVGVLLFKKVIHAALCLIICLSSISGVFVFAGADFVAVTQLMVYVGGVLVLLLFGVMLSTRLKDSDRPNVLRIVLGGVVGIAGFGFLSYAILHSNYVLTVGAQNKSTVEKLGVGIMTDFILPFEIAAIILLIALIAAAFIAGRKEDNTI